jgi:hypothetical protein
MNDFQQVRLEFQQRIDDRKFEHDQALDRRDEILSVIPPTPEKVEEDAESMERTLQGIRDRGAGRDKDRNLREEAEAFMAPGKPAEVEAPPPELEAEFALLSARLLSAEDEHSRRAQLLSLATDGPSVDASMPAEEALRLGLSGGAGGAEETTATTGHAGTFDLDAVNIEVTSEVIDVDLANDKIIIKKGFSGVYKVSITCEGEITSASSGASAGRTKAVVKQDGVSAFEWSFLIGTNAASSTGTDYENSSTSSKMIYIDASAADVALTVDYDMSTTGGVGGSVTLRLMQFSAMLGLTAQAYNKI